MRSNNYSINGFFRRLFSFHSIQNKIIFWVFLPCFCVLGAVAFFALGTIEKSAMKVVTERDAVLAELSGKRLAENLREYQRYLQDLGQHPAVRVKNYDWLKELFTEAVNWQHLFDEGIALYDKTGVLLWDSQQETFHSNSVFPDPAGFTEIRNSLRPYFSDVIMKSDSDVKIILLAVPLIDADNSFSGVMTGFCSVQYSAIGASYTRLLEYKAGRSNFAYIIDGQGVVLYHRHSSLIGTTIVDSRLAQKGTGAVVLDQDDGKVISGYAPIPGTKWRLVTSSSWNPIKDMVHFYSRLFLLILWGGGAISAILVFFLIQKLMGPVRELTRGAEHIADGSFVEVPVQRTQDEVELLADRFNFMVRAVRTSFKATELRIVELDQARQDLAQSEEELRQIINSVSDIMFMVDLDGVIVWMNDKGEEVFGSGAAGTIYSEVFYQSPNIPDNCFIQDYFTGSIDENVEVKIWAEEKYQDYWCSANAVQFNDNGKVTKVVVVCRNITERKKIRQEMQRHSQLSALGELSAGVAHEINNPVTGIINYAQIIKDIWAEKGNKNEHLPDWIIQEGKRIAVIVSKLLSFARRDIAQKQPVFVEEVVNHVLDLSNTMLRKECIIVDCDLPSDLPPVAGVAHQIHQIVLNIINNSRYALNKKVFTSGSKKKIKINFEECVIGAEKMVRIVFIDQGIGISSNILEKVCNPFFSTKPAGEGTGLGLSISYGIVEEHGGELKVESVEGKWTKVTIDLPVWNVDRSEKT